MADQSERWIVRHISGANVHVQEFDIRVDWDGRPVYPVFNRSNFGIEGATVHCSPRHALLIGAAPELLAMVRRYASECAECGDGHSDDFDPDGSECPECADIRALIRKAEGKS